MKITSKNKVYLRILTVIITLPIWILAAPFALITIIIVYGGALIGFAYNGIWDINW
jgi:hypothetical protein